MLIRMLWMMTQCYIVNCQRYLPPAWNMHRRLNTKRYLSEYREMDIPHTWLKWVFYVVYALHVSIYYHIRYGANQNQTKLRAIPKRWHRLTSSVKTAVCENHIGHIHGAHTKCGTNRDGQTDTPRGRQRDTNKPTTSRTHNTHRKWHGDRDDTHNSRLLMVAYAAHPLQGVRAEFATLLADAQAAQTARGATIDDLAQIVAATGATVIGGVDVSGCACGWCCDAGRSIITNSDGWRIDCWSIMMGAGAGSALKDASTTSDSTAAGPTPATNTNSITTTCNTTVGCAAIGRRFKCDTAHRDHFFFVFFPFVAGSERSLLLLLRLLLCWRCSVGEDITAVGTIERARDHRGEFATHAHHAMILHIGGAHQPTDGGEGGGLGEYVGWVGEWGFLECDGGAVGVNISWRWRRWFGSVQMMWRCSDCRWWIYI